MKAGDLLHIPQAVMLWNMNESGANLYMQTEKPLTGIYLGGSLKTFGRGCPKKRPPSEHSHVLSVFVNGKCWAVHEKDVYLFKEESEC